MVDSWTLNYNGALTIGDGTDYTVRSVQGLGLPESRGYRGERGDLHGDVAGKDVLQGRQLFMAVVVTGTSPSDTWSNFQALLAAWKPTGTTDAYLDIALPGVGTYGRRFYGRPGNVRDDGLVHLGVNFINCLLTFQALDPLGYGEEESSGAESGTFAVVNDGTAATDRVTLTLVAAGGIPTIKNAADENKTIKFGSAITGTYTIDLRSKTVLDGSSADDYASLSPVNQWFTLQPGSNSITLTNATSVDVAWEPAYF